MFYGYYKQKVIIKLRYQTQFEIYFITQTDVKSKLSY